MIMCYQLINIERQEIFKFNFYRSATVTFLNFPFPPQFYPHHLLYNRAFAAFRKNVCKEFVWKFLLFIRVSILSRASHEPDEWWEYLDNHNAIGMKEGKKCSQNFVLSIRSCLRTFHFRCLSIGGKIASEKVFEMWMISKPLFCW